MDTLSPQNRIEVFLLSSNDFITYCKERGIYIDDDLLSYYVTSGFLTPITVEDDERYYDPLQIYHINQIENYRQNILRITPKNKKSWQDELNDNKERLSKGFEGFSPAMKLLQAIRYYYLPQLTGVLSIKNQTTTSEKWTIEKEKFDPQSIVKELGLSVDKIERWRTNLAFAANSINPFEFSDWYIFLKNLQHKDRPKYKLIKGSVLLAQDYYLMAEMLTIVLGKISNKKIIPIDAIFDFTGGKWREKKCEICDKIFQRKSSNERYCGNCKKAISETTQGAWRCEKCQSVFYKFLDNNELLNKLFAQSKGENQIEIYARLEYGLLILEATCRCGHKNRKQIRQGWW